MAGEPRLEPATHVRPLRRQDAVHHRVPRGAIPPRLVVADHAVLRGAQRLDRPLRPAVVDVGPQPHDLAAEGLEGVAHEQQLAGGIDVAALPPRGVPGVADFDAVDRGHDVVEPRAADHRVRRQLTHRPGQRVAGLLPRQRLGDVRRGFAGRRHARIPQLPQPPVPRRRGERLRVRDLEGLQPDAVAFQCRRGRRDHGREPPAASATSALRRSAPGSDSCRRSSRQPGR